MVALRNCAQYFNRSEQSFLRNVCIGWFCYALGSILEDTIGVILLLMVNVKIKHNFDRPWLSQSVRELWSRRYNILVSEVLRSVSYEPIYEGKSTVRFAVRQEFGQVAGCADRSTSVGESLRDCVNLWLSSQHSWQVPFFIFGL